MRCFVAAVSGILLLSVLYVPNGASGQSVTGDIFVDARLNEFPFQWRGGNNDSPNWGPGNYPGNVWDCNSPSAPPEEGNCPSDLLYTPNANTGGYQAYGVGLRNFPGGIYYYSICFPIWYYDWEYPQMYWECIWIPMYIPDMAYGVAAARIRFGSVTTGTPWSGRPMSTLAFKANTVYLPEYGPAVCTPDFNLLPAGAPCETNPLVGVPTQNVYAVIDAGFEDKIVMDDYGCNATPILGRSGQPSDAENGCFVRDLISPANWGSDLPAPYIDTTAFDDGELYQPGAGSANPEAIIEGAAYVWYTGFYQYGLESTATHTLRHISSVTSYVDNAISQAIGCESSKPEFCYFQTDQTNIGPSDQLD